MHHPLNSPEFAQAWRTVSESLLHHLQQGGTMPTLDIPQTQRPETITITDTPPAYTPPAYTPPAHTTPPPTATATATATVKLTGYTTRPIPQGDGTYLFKNIREDRNEGSLYKITIYTNSTARFELCTDLSPDDRQILIDNSPEYIPTAVGTTTGTLKADSQIINTNPGTGATSGRSVRITSPMTVEFR